MKQKVLVMWYGIWRQSIVNAMKDFKAIEFSKTENPGFVWYLEICKAKDNFQSKVNKIHSQKPKNQEISSRKFY